MLHHIRERNLTLYLFVPELAIYSTVGYSVNREKFADINSTEIGDWNTRNQDTIHETHISVVNGKQNIRGVPRQTSTVFKFNRFQKIGQIIKFLYVQPSWDI
jgi:hypothetical protein